MKYSEQLDKTVEHAYKRATAARKKGFDPEDKVAIPIAKDMAERVEGLISVIAPQIINSGVSKRIKALEKQYGILDWRVSLIIAEEIAQQRYCKFKDQQEAMEVGIRVGFAYHTLGTVASPIEGFVKWEVKKRNDGKEYMCLYFSGPIRSAGGTGASVSVLIADYVRKKFGYDVYDPTDEEIQRMVSEVYDYHERITNLQYLPSEEELRFMVKNVPVQINGDPSEKIEVSKGKDLPRIETNTIRNGVCLVLGEALSQKAPKVWKQLSKWGKEFGLEHWNFLEEFIAIQKQAKAKGSQEVQSKDVRIMPDYTFIKDLVAGRPILTHPMRAGGFRLRYGRCRTSGYSSCCIHPATMIVLKGYIATGTQLKLERPGKAAVVNPCDTIEGPIVKLASGEMRLLESVSEAKKYLPEVTDIFFLGDILINYGDFLNRAHTLVPPGYCEEFWVQELEKAIVDVQGTLDVEKAASFLHISPSVLKEVLDNPLKRVPPIEGALLLAEQFSAPLHPAYTYHYGLLSKDNLKSLLSWVVKGEIKGDKLVLPMAPDKQWLERIGLPHLVALGEFIVLQRQESLALLKTFGVESPKALGKTIEKLERWDREIIPFINSLGPIKIRDKSGMFIGARMGRPEKAKQRKLTGSPHVLFPVGEEGGKMRSVIAALDVGKVTAEFPSRICPSCKKETIYNYCSCSGKPTEELRPIKEIELPIKQHFDEALALVGMKVYPDMIKGVRGTSNKGHIPEHLVKGILRAKHDVYVNKDGTIRYDMTQMGITHFRPREIHTPVKKLIELGYEKDMNGAPLTQDDQLLEIFPQDVILPAPIETTDEGADKVLFNAGNFIDELLTLVYKQEPYYQLESPADLVGHLILALAPHTSAAITGRIIGFSQTQGFYAHPMFHAAQRRDLDGDESCVMLMMDAFLNFSRSFLPAHRGSTQDACLVITTTLNPSEVDDMVFDVDTASRYPLSFYLAACEYKKPWEAPVDTFVKKLGQENFMGWKFTHDVSDMNMGVNCSAYKILPSMEEKLKGQMDLAKMIVAVDEEEVAKAVIEKHFLKDIKGNLRKFSTQQFRCVNCNIKFRRPPLIGKCTKCGGKIIFTISEGSVIKYLEPSLSLVRAFNLPPYLSQTMDLLQRRIDEVFGKDAERQEGLGKWFG
ncbi:DNA polymerase II large subunit [Candidatus Woesearchaeota archaeon]|nr:MAG: DNA polymerase II large subunit [archaeon GW2011_AR4]MBS3129133.1 DNA polymerase II large subunit [Candidatus Woesearchaeota archaeon]HIH37865.1 DNA polymerase II large subunit [Candidatus Woesearchaeota archaeon]HIH49238.1 DNA polymerase II large subunit [Candidatus Woesearchaeota archaeon]HIJ03993.1 DNA polymerase II large subunit [Candidatus Woesearchaeota archaeon]